MSRRYTREDCASIQPGVTRQGLAASAFAFDASLTSVEVEERPGAVVMRFRPALEGGRGERFRDEVRAAGGIHHHRNGH